MNNVIIDMNDVVEFIYNQINKRIDKDSIIEILDLEMIYLEKFDLIEE